MGPIPARTGQPDLGGSEKGKDGAYPRSHGATACILAVPLAIWGLSPLARGNQGRELPEVSQEGPIPARTGQPEAGDTGAEIVTAYPRSHGAT